MKIFQTAEMEKIWIDYAMNQIEQVSCVKFKKDNQFHYINITNNATLGCITDVGYMKKKGQIMNLTRNCSRPGSIMHELMHAVGFYHQHMSIDRDDYVRINVSNIIEGKEYNFIKLHASVASNLGLGYDIHSIMHYRPRAHSKNNETTITAKDGKDKGMGQRQGLSRIDIQKIKKLYNC